MGNQLIHFLADGTIKFTHNNIFNYEREAHIITADESSWRIPYHGTVFHCLLGSVVVTSVVVTLIVTSVS